jgi:hypothetical protein
MIVHVVFDPGFGARLAETAGAGHVWLVDSPENRAAAERPWAARSGGPASGSVSTFELEEGPTAASVRSVFEMLEDHHGPGGCGFGPWTRLVVHGLALTPEIEEWFAGDPPVRISRTTHGFECAVDSPPA